jgi:hypothetical protein
MHRGNFRLPLLSLISLDVVALGHPIAVWLLIPRSHRRLLLGIQGGFRPFVRSLLERGPPLIGECHCRTNEMARPAEAARREMKANGEK